MADRVIDRTIGRERSWPGAPPRPNRRLFVLKVNGNVGADPGAPKKKPAPVWRGGLLVRLDSAPRRAFVKLNASKLSKLGEGGMDVIYKAEDTRLKRTLALNVMQMLQKKEAACGVNALQVVWYQL